MDRKIVLDKDGGDRLLTISLGSGKDGLENKPDLLSSHASSEVESHSRKRKHGKRKKRKQKKQRRRSYSISSESGRNAAQQAEKPADRSERGSAQLYRYISAGAHKHGSQLLSA